MFEWDITCVEFMDVITGDTVISSCLLDNVIGQVFGSAGYLSDKTPKQAVNKPPRQCVARM